MALFPIHARERDALGLFKAHSTDYDSALSEGGRVVELKADGTDLAVANIGASAADTPLHGLLDEQGAKSTLETSVGRFLPANATPVVLGPHTYLGSGRVSVWVESGWFLTDCYDLTVDGYGEATAAPGTKLSAKSSDGELTDGSGEDTRVYFMKMVNDLDDLLATRVTPAPTTGLFAEQAPILIYQSDS